MESVKREGGHVGESAPVDDVLEIEDLLKGAESPKMKASSIYKVPDHIRESNQAAYTPKFVSIGPLHHNPQKFQYIKRYKVKFLKEMLLKGNLKSEDWVAAVRGMESHVRGSYSDPIVLSSHELCVLLSVDAAFILELLWRNYYWEWSTDDQNFLGLRNAIQLDLLLLENQLPFYFLDKLYQLAFNKRVLQLPSFADLTFHYFTRYNLQNVSPRSSALHFSAVIRYFHLPLEKLMHRKRVMLPHIHAPAASQLIAAGLLLKPTSAKDRALLDLRLKPVPKYTSIVFPGGILEIPPLKVDDTTEVIFRNLLALEQCHYHYEGYFMDYVLLMSFLVDTAQDVDILVRRGIIVNGLGDSAAVACLFKSLAKTFTALDFNSEYYEICSQLNKFYAGKWQSMRAKLRRDYFDTPWKVIAVFIGFQLVVLAAIQAVFSILRV